MSHTSINIASALQTGPYRLRLLFDDKTVQDLDFGPFLAHSHHPDIRAYLDPARFADFKLQYGELVWGDYPNKPLAHVSIAQEATNSIASPK